MDILQQQQVGLGNVLSQKQTSYVDHSIYKTL